MTLIILDILNSSTCSIFFLLKELLFSFQLFEEGKVEEAVLHAAHSPKVSNTLSFVITVSTLSHLTFCFVFGYGIV